MCGRYSIAIEPTEIEDQFRARFEEPMKPRYNAAPSQMLPVIINEAPGTVRFLRWGLMPPWIEKIKKRDGLINVRAETLRDRHTFQHDLRERRCLVIADGFYEWRKTPSGGKIPYRITAKNGSPMGFAGIWEVNHDKKGNKVPTFAIITTAANKLMAPIHARMPVIFWPRDKSKWLQERQPLPNLIERLKPVDDRNLRAYEVSRLVNRASVDSREVIQPV